MTERPKARKHFLLIVRLTEIFQILPNVSVFDVESLTMLIMPSLMIAKVWFIKIP